jgi:hypothetical protein
MTDVQGLDRAYARDNGIYVYISIYIYIYIYIYFINIYIYIYIYIRNTTMFAAGTKDFHKTTGMIWKFYLNWLLQIYDIYADKALQMHAQLTSLVGHSLGGAVFVGYAVSIPR